VGNKPLITARPNVEIIIDNNTIRCEKLVYNPAAIKINGVTYLLYRALGYDGISRIGLAWSKDGIHNWQRLDFPIFGPTEDYELPLDIETRRANQIKEFGEIREVGGTEDPRVTIIGNYLYMTYTAYGEIPQVAIARIKISDFLDAIQQGKNFKQWQNLWQRQGIISSGGKDKDAVILPVTNGYYIMHRIEPDMQIYFTPTLPPNSYREIGDTFMKPRAGMWDSEKIGAGAPPLKTKYGWLFIYHGVGTWQGKRAYRLGVVLTDLSNPEKKIYRSQEPILEPQEDYEINGWVDNVVFTCGAVPEDKDSDAVLDKDDEILVYYGAADKVIAVAKAKISDLIPESIIKSIP
jgi:predicted GH43/DUF377 family glycosyl hydrolase